MITATRYPNGAGLVDLNQIICAHSEHEPEAIPITLGAPVGIAIKLRVES